MTKQLSTHLFALLLLLAGLVQPGFAQPIETMGEGEYVPSLVVRMLDRILVQMNEITGMYAAMPEK